MLIWGKMKTYALLILSGLVSVLGLLLTISGSRSKRLKRQAETYKAKAHHAKKVMEKDVEIEREHDERTEKLADEIEKKKTSSELSEPNEW
mgnify:CR=1 FL=1